MNSSVYHTKVGKKNYNYSFPRLAMKPTTIAFSIVRRHLYTSKSENLLLWTVKADNDPRDINVLKKEIRLMIFSFYNSNNETNKFEENSVK